MPIKHFIDLLGIRPSAIRLSRTLRDMHHFGIRSTEKLDQAIDRIRMLTADIEALADDIRLRCRKKCINDIGDISEIPRLFARSNDRIRFSRQLLSEEHAEHRAIRSRCAGARTVDVEQAE